MTKFREVSGKICIITGAARGIGYGCAEALAAEGVHVVLVDVIAEVQEAWSALQEKYPENQGFAMQVDISKEAEVAQMIAKTVEKFGRIDIMYCNAGSTAENGKSVSCART